MRATRKDLGNWKVWGRCLCKCQNKVWARSKQNSAEHIARRTQESDMLLEYWTKRARITTKRDCLFFNPHESVAMKIESKFKEHCTCRLPDYYEQKWTRANESRLAWIKILGINGLLTKLICFSQLGWTILFIVLTSPNQQHRREQCTAVYCS